MILGIYAVSLGLQRAACMSALVNPLLITLGAVVVCLCWSGTNVESFQNAVRILDFLLGTAVVALAVPLHGLLRRFGARAVMLAPAIILGSIASTYTAIKTATWLGASQVSVATVAPRTATSAIAAELSRLLGGLPAATILLCIISGILGAMVGPLVMKVTGVLSPSARGLAYGTASHAIGAARAFSESEETGSWATLAMCLNAVVATLMVRLLMDR
ncbi:MAG: LrgB family protein, partial [Proteobacteria bacterium]|nr:LrgB family protein [Pseudomonadota bacterium]